MVLVIIGAMAFAVFQPVQVLPRLRLAPGYALVDQSGATVTSEAGRGVITLATFVPLECDDACDRVDDTMRTVRDRVVAEGKGGVTEGMPLSPVEPEEAEAGGFSG